MRLASPGFGVRDCATRLVLCLAATIAALSPACFAQAQTNYEHTLACVLHDLAGRPLSGVAIELRSVSPPLEKIRALTGSDGSFTFDGLREGEYIVTAAGGLVSPPQHIQIHDAQAMLALRLPIELPLIPGRTADLVSVQQLRTPTKAQQILQKAIDAWSRNDTRLGRTLTLRALQEQPDYAPALMLAGALDLQDGHPDEAIAHLLQSIQQAPDSPRAYLILASAYNQQQRNVEALDALSIAALFVSGSWQLHYETGRAYLGQGRFKNAFTEFDRAQQASAEDNMLLRLGKAHALLGSQNYEGARQELAGILEKSPNGAYSDESRKLAALIDARLKKPAPSVAAHPANAHPNVAATVRIEH